MDKQNALNYIGNLSQLCGSRHYELTDGWARKMRAIDINTGAGLHYTILPDRALDISLASYKGTNLVFLTNNSETHPGYFEPQKLGWLRTFAGGLLTTCGLTSIGPPSLDQEEYLGLHGRISTTPARQVSDNSEWLNGDYHIRISGIVEEGFLFGNKIRLTREINSILGTNSISLNDTIENVGNKKSPYTIMYHMNFGYPLLDETAELIINPSNTIPRDDVAKSGLSKFNKFERPQTGFSEQVFTHVMKEDNNGMGSVSLENKNLGIRINLSFGVNQLPYLTQWKMMGIGEYVLGLEPCNTFCKSRKDLREEGLLPMLEAGEKINNKVEFSVESI